MLDTSGTDSVHANSGMIRSYGRVLMPVIRLLALVLLCGLWTAPALAQTPQNDASNLVIFQGAASMNVVQSLTAASPQANSATSAPAKQAVRDKVLLASAGDQDRHFHNEPGFSLGPDSERTCYYIRDYVVIRDSPHSDSVHRDGSSTCVPGARFRVYTTAEPLLKIEK